MVIVLLFLIAALPFAMVIAALRVRTPVPDRALTFRTQRGFTVRAQRGMNRARMHRLTPV